MTRTPSRVDGRLSGYAVAAAVILHQLVTPGSEAAVDRAAFRVQWYQRYPRHKPHSDRQGRKSRPHCKYHCRAVRGLADAGIVNREQDTIVVLDTARLTEIIRAHAAAPRRVRPGSVRP